MAPRTHMGRLLCPNPVFFHHFQRFSYFSGKLGHVPYITPDPPALAGPYVTPKLTLHGMIIPGGSILVPGPGGWFWSVGRFDPGGKFWMVIWTLDPGGGRGLSQSSQGRDNAQVIGRGCGAGFQHQTSQVWVQNLKNNSQM